jgi:hypothetical protein
VSSLMWDDVGRHTAGRDWVRSGRVGRIPCIAVYRYPAL